MIRLGHESISYTTCILRLILLPAGVGRAHSIYKAKIPNAVTKSLWFKKYAREYGLYITKYQEKIWDRQGDRFPVQVGVSGTTIKVAIVM